MTTEKWDINYRMLRRDLARLTRGISRDPKAMTGSREKDLLKAVDTLIGTAYLQGIEKKPLEDVFPWVLPER